VIARLFQLNDANPLGSVQKILRDTGVVAAPAARSWRGSTIWCAFFEQSSCRGYSNRAICNEIVPDPVVVADHRRGIEMWPITQRMAIANDDDIVVVRNC
jgi:hypothetical protein